MGSKRVKFNPEVTEYSPTQFSESEGDEPLMNSESELELDSDEDGSEEIGSDPEDMESGKFLTRIKRERIQAQKERKYLVNTLKVKSRVGSIFFDKVQRVVAAI